MPGENIQDWSVTAVNNGTADTSINWAEGQPRASVNNSARSMMAAHAKERDLKNGSIITTGSANAQAFTSGVTYTSVPTGLRVRLKMGFTNTTAATLNMDGIGAVAILTQTGAALVAGQLTANAYNEFIYNGTNWILLGAVLNAPVLTAPVITGGLTTDTATISGALNSSTLSLSGGGLAATGFTSALRLTAWGDNVMYGITIRLMLDNSRNIQFTNSVDSVIGSIDNISGSVTAYNTTCDGNLKTDIEDLPPGNVIDGLRPVKFKWKDRLDTGEWAGFIAQEAYKAAPQAVTPSRDGKPWMMDYSKLVPLLVAELKSLRKRVAELEAR